MAEATSYEVKVIGPGIRWQMEVEGDNSIRYPENAPPLQPSKRYLVIVEARNEEGAIADSRADENKELAFTVATENERSQLEEFRSQDRAGRSVSSSQKYCPRRILPMGTLV